jgi:hypothetical protein
MAYLAIIKVMSPAKFNSILCEISTAAAFSRLVLFHGHAYRWRHARGIYTLVINNQSDLGQVYISSKPQLLGRIWAYPADKVPLYFGIYTSITSIVTLDSATVNIGDTHNAKSLVTDFQQIIYAKSRSVN